ncbi:MAG: ABC transporter ATP-binding protein [Planctomycetes bacterium]|nr:ABC transporter ATP-binding protein [Planctomycetota bacterium]
MSDSPVIEVDALCKVYRDGWLRRRRLEVLNGLNFDVRPGEIFGLLGPNGAGKTTFVKILLGIVRKTAGQARLLGFPAGDRRSRRQVGFLPENLRIARHHTANTALDYYGKLSGLSAAQVRRRRDGLLRTVGLADRAKDGVGKYSKGMLQRLGLAQALLHDPRLVMLDEPTDGLDPVGRAHVRRIMQSLKAEGKTVFINSHLLQEIELVCDRVAILDQGRLRYVGPVKDVTDAGQGDMVAGLDAPNLHLELAGEDPQIHAALAGAEIAAWERAANGLLTVVLKAVAQDEVDRRVDQLRKHGVSIVSLSRERKTLEDAFLAIVAEAVE